MAFAQMNLNIEWGTTTPSSGFILKAYEPGTTTSINIAIDKDGGSPQASLTTNAEGKFEVSSNEVLPYIDRNHKWALFANAVDAAANSNPFAGFYDNVQVGAVSSDFQVDNFVTLRAKTSTIYNVGDLVQVTDDGIGGPFIFKSGTVVDNGGTLIVSDDDSTKHFERRYDDSRINVTWFGAVGDNSTDNSTAILNTIVEARRIRQLASELTNITVFFPDQEDSYNHTTAIPVVTGIYLAAETRDSATLKNTGTDASLYTATESSGTFTDNLDQVLNVNTAENNGIINLRITHTGTLSGNSPDSATPWRAVVHLYNTPRIEVSNLRISTTTNWLGGIYIKNSFGAQFFRLYIVRGSGNVGGIGCHIDSVNNSMLIHQPFIFGNWAIGYKSGNPDTVTLVEPNLEQAWVNCSLNGDSQKIYGGYMEGGAISEIDLGWDSPTSCQEWLISNIWLNGSGQLPLVDDHFQWTLSGSGTSEYYLERLGGGDPQVSTPWTLEENSIEIPKGTVGSLSAGEWIGFKDNDGLGFTTVYVRLTDSADPDSKATGFLTTGLHLIRFGRCQGGQLERKHIEGVFTKEFASETAANGNLGNEIGLPRGDASLPDLPGRGLDAGRNVVKVIGQDFSDHRQLKWWSTENNAEIETELNQRGAEWCQFTLRIRNLAGVMNHSFYLGVDTITPAYTGSLVGNVTTNSVTPTVSSVVDFTAGAGFDSANAAIMVLDSDNNQILTEACLQAQITRNFTNTSLTCNIHPAGKNVNGITINRPSIQFFDIAGANFDLTTANILTGERIEVQIQGFMF